MPATYQEEQEQVKAEFHQAAEEEEEEGESLLTLRKKGKEEMWVNVGVWLGTIHYMNGVKSSWDVE